MKRKVPQVEAGEWIQPIRNGYELLCCDCNLNHVMQFRIYKGKIQFRAWRKGDKDIPKKCKRKGAQ